MLPIVSNKGFGDFWADARYVMESRKSNDKNNPPEDVIMLDYRMNWPLPDEFLVELGRVSALWGALEGALNIAIGKLAGFDELADPVPFVLTVHSSFPQRLDTLGALCELRLPTHPTLKGYKEVISKIKAAQSKRNKFVHNLITFSPELKKYVLATGSARQSVKTSVTEVTSAQIHEACKEIHLASLALHELITSKRYEPVWNRSST